MKRKQKGFWEVDEWAEKLYDELVIIKKTGVEHIPSTKELLKSVICEHDEVILAYLYGSAVQGNLRADSDIDIGILLADDAVQTSARRSEYGFHQQI